MAHQLVALFFSQIENDLQTTEVISPRNILHNRSTVCSNTKHSIDERQVAFQCVCLSWREEDSTDLTEILNLWTAFWSLMKFRRDWSVHRVVFVLFLFLPQFSLKRKVSSRFSMRAFGSSKTYLRQTKIKMAITIQQRTQIKAKTLRMRWNQLICSSDLGRTVEESLKWIADRIQRLKDDRPKPFSWSTNNDGGFGGGRTVNMGGGGSSKRRAFPKSIISILTYHSIGWRSLLVVFATKRIVCEAHRRFSRRDSLSFLL